MKTEQELIEYIKQLNKQDEFDHSPMDTYEQSTGYYYALSWVLEKDTEEMGDL